MNILFCTFVFENGGARNVDTKLIKEMSKNHQVPVLSKKDRLTEDVPGITIVENKHYETKYGKAKLALGILRNMYLAARYARKTNPDMIYISVYETRLLPIGRLFFRKQDNLVIHENINIDMLDSRLYLLCYKAVANKVRHVVYEQFMKDYLVNEIGVSKEKIFLIPHSYYPQMLSSKNNSGDSEYDCIAISGSNDENLIEQIVNIEKSDRVFEKNKIKILVKSKNIEFDDGYLKVTNKFFSRDEYNDFYRKCKVVYVPFPTSYKYRMSGCIIDGFSAHKPVVSSNFMLAQHYMEKYEGNIFAYEKVEDAINKIGEICSCQNSSYDFSKFEYEHSGNAISKCLEILEKDIKNN